MKKIEAEKVQADEKLKLLNQDIKSLNLLATQRAKLNHLRQTKTEKEKLYREQYFFFPSSPSIIIFFSFASSLLPFLHVVLLPILEIPKTVFLFFSLLFPSSKRTFFLPCLGSSPKFRFGECEAAFSEILNQKPQISTLREDLARAIRKKRAEVRNEKIIRGDIFWRVRGCFFGGKLFFFRQKSRED
jgi:hypothetical protein